VTSNGAFQPQMKIAQGPRHGGFERSAWGADEPHTLSRTIFFYFNPSQLGIGPDLGVWHSSLPPRLFFEDGSLTDTALKLAALVESGGSDQRRYLEALGVVMTHELGLWA